MATTRENFSIYDLAALNLDEATLITIRDTAMAGLTSGKVLTSVSAPNLSTAFEIFATPMQLLRASIYALQLINPSMYGNAPANQTIGFVR